MYNKQPFSNNRYGLMNNLIELNNYFDNLNKTNTNDHSINQPNRQLNCDVLKQIFCKLQPTDIESILNLRLANSFFYQMIKELFPKYVSTHTYQVNPHRIIQQLDKMYSLTLEQKVKFAIENGKSLLIMDLRRNSSCNDKSYLNRELAKNLVDACPNIREIRLKEIKDKEYSAIKYIIQKLPKLKRLYSTCRYQLPVDLFCQIIGKQRLEYLKTPTFTGIHPSLITPLSHLRTLKFENEIDPALLKRILWENANLEFLSCPNLSVNVWEVAAFNCNEIKKIVISTPISTNELEMIIKHFPKLTYLYIMDEIKGTITQNSIERLVLNHAHLRAIFVPYLGQQFHIEGCKIDIEKGWLRLIKCPSLNDKKQIEQALEGLFSDYL